MFKGILKGQSFWVKIIALIGMAIFSMSMFTAISALLVKPLFGINIVTDAGSLMDFNNPATVAAYKFLQIVQAIALFIIPALIFPYLCGENTVTYLKMRKQPVALLFLLVLLLSYFSSPLFELTNQLNQKMALPQFLKGLEDWMKAKEDQLNDLTKVFLKMDNLNQLWLNLFMMAILPAIGEEFLFRGVAQRLFIEGFKNAHLGIWVAAIVFSTLHFQFYGFLPRMLLGVLFGYLFYWSGNIWLAIFAHFVNNATVVVFSYMFQHKIINFNIDDSNSLSVAAYLVCFLVSTSLLLAFYRFATKKTSLENYGSSLDQNL
ncbi:CPBP family intramembrane metalloprotease domain-containing protein [Solitalea longa]|uniref:CPBP family intramembrane metalloprotease domain-containing protein n=1 Tax=Solitalea longa TaxID=2079460 RepID=A0A2S5A3S1_9SPHI|nr:CPBP family intramembrane glutamic endopeptidase [Solitalea longa]POY37185.1 CPBP family intramembrane metalloprotease domain-containing protein [Solitalea longa]